MQWFQDNRELFISLGSRYTKKTPMEQSFYAYFVGQYKLCGRSREDAITAQMLLFVIQSSIYSCEFVDFRYREVLKSIPVAVVWGTMNQARQEWTSSLNGLVALNIIIILHTEMFCFLPLIQTAKTMRSSWNILKKPLKAHRQNGLW